MWPATINSTQPIGLPFAYFDYTRTIRSCVETKFRSPTCVTCSCYCLQLVIGVRTSKCLSPNSITPTFARSRREGIWPKRDVTDLLRTSRGSRHSGIMALSINNWPHTIIHLRIGEVWFLPCDAMRCTALVIVILSVCPSACHARALCPHGSTYDHAFFSIW